MGDKFYLCDNKILCEYDYEERLVFASMANHPILKRHATTNCTNSSPVNLQNSATHTNGHHHNLLASMNQRAQANDLNNNSNAGGMNFGAGSHLKQHVITN